MNTRRIVVIGDVHSYWMHSLLALFACLSSHYCSNWSLTSSEFNGFLGGHVGSSRCCSRSWWIHSICSLIAAAAADSIVQMDISQYPPMPNIQRVWRISKKEPPTSFEEIRSGYCSKNSGCSVAKRPVTMFDSITVEDGCRINEWMSIDLAFGNVGINPLIDGAAIDNWSAPPFIDYLFLKDVSDAGATPSINRFDHLHHKRLQICMYANFRPLGLQIVLTVLLIIIINPNISKICINLLIDSIGISLSWK